MIAARRLLVFLTVCAASWAVLIGLVWAIWFVAVSLARALTVLAVTS